MSLHSRPIPAPKTPVRVSSTHFTTHLVSPEPPPAPPAPVSDHTDAASEAEPSRVSEFQVEPSAAGESSPWYRRESWIVVLMVAFVPLIGAFIAPDTLQYPLIGMSVVGLVIGAIMLVRQGVHRPPAGSRSI